MKCFLMTIVAAVLAISARGAEEMPSREAMWELLQAQSRRIAALEGEVARLSGDVRTSQDRLETVADMAEKGTAPSLLGTGTKIGGYGEMHYNNLRGSGGTADKDEIDFHRFVAFMSHDFNERIRFFSEVELEHAFNADGEPGEVELEQAYVEMDLGDDAAHRAKAGLFLVPVGLINETHEPPTFYGVERNSVEAQIIPSTWWEGGLGVSGRLSDEFKYDLALTSGLEVDAGFKIRDGRQKVAKAKANDGALTARLTWQKPGLQLGVAANYQQDVTQGGAPESADALLLEAHADFHYERFGLRALAARWDIDAAAAEALGRDVQQGWYLEPSYRINEQVGLFARWSQWDNEAGNAADTVFTQWDVGVNYWPHEDVVLKLDYQVQDQPGGKGLDGINLGVGFQF